MARQSFRSQSIDDCPREIDDKEDCSAFGEDNHMWDPQGKSRAMVLQQETCFSCHLESELYMQYKLLTLVS